MTGFQTLSWPFRNFGQHNNIQNIICIFMNKRLRKKLHKGEFSQYGFEFSVGELIEMWK